MEIFVLLISATLSITIKVPNSKSYCNKLNNKYIPTYMVFVKNYII